MLEYLQACIDQREKAAHTANLVRVLRDFPDDDLRALVEGRAKLAFGPCPDGWIDKFKGTSLLSKAVELEKQELEIEVAQEQARAQRRQARQEMEAQLDAGQPDMGEFGAHKDEVGLQKRLLDLELLEVMGGAGAQPSKGPEMPVKVEVQHPPPPKPVGEGEAMLAAGEDAPKTAGLATTGVRQLVGSAMPAVSQAVWGARRAAQPLMQAAAPLARQAVGWAAKNPEAAGAAVGAAGGAMAAGEGHRMQGAIGGVALGAAGGHMLRQPPSARGVLGGTVMARGGMPTATNPSKLAGLLGELGQAVVRNPRVTGAVAGGVGGGALGAVAGGPDHRLGGAATGAGLGAVAGLGAGHAVGTHMATTQAAAGEKAVMDELVAQGKVVPGWTKHDYARKEFDRLQARGNARRESLGLPPHQMIY